MAPKPEPTSTVMDNAPKFDMTDTWNSGDISYNATKMNVTDQHTIPAKEKRRSW